MYFPEDSYDEATLTEISRIPLHSAIRIPVPASHVRKNAQASLPASNSVLRAPHVRAYQVSVSALRK
jgi:hypothetical protein